jgi:predicted PurR-regulated permease PerM
VIAPWVRTVLVVGCALGLGLFFHAAASTLVILIGGFFVALVLSFPVNALARLMPRGAAILATALLVLAIVALALLFAVPLLLAQLTELVRAIPGFAAASAARIGQWLAALEARGLLPADTDTVVAGAQTALFARARQLAEELLGQLSGAIFGSFFATLILTSTTLVIALYFLVDVRGVKVAFLRLPPRRYRRDAAALWDTIAQTYRRWLGALLLSMLFEAVVAWLGLWALGLPFAPLLGIWMGLTAAIPYVGAWLGAIPGVFLALLDSPRTALLAGGLYLLINVTDGNLIAPRLQGNAVGAPPVVVIVAVIGGGQIFGVLGAFLAVPTLAFLRIAIVFLRARLQVRPAANQARTAATGYQPPGD